MYVCTKNQKINSLISHNPFGCVFFLMFYMRELTFLFQETIITLHLHYFFFLSFSSSQIESQNHFPPLLTLPINTVN